VASKWFARDTLFEEDFDCYPLDADRLDRTDIESIDQLVEELLHFSTIEDAARTTGDGPAAVEEALARILVGQENPRNGSTDTGIID
jgi:hypothetical protein